MRAGTACGAFSAFRRSPTLDAQNFALELSDPTLSLVPRPARHRAGLFLYFNKNRHHPSERQPSLNHTRERQHSPALRNRYRRHQIKTSPPPRILNPRTRIARYSATPTFPPCSAVASQALRTVVSFLGVWRRGRVSQIRSPWRDTLARWMTRPWPSLANSGH
jgi:hypothetical protein